MTRKAWTGSRKMTRLIMFLACVSDPEKYVFTEGKRVLTVKSVQKSTDITCFQCYVSNSEGEEFGNGCLNVICELPFS